tara:strand:- start:1862 stop:2764 length:903 start_codon:yes stop_codon:yes gene_type:complete
MKLDTAYRLLSHPFYLDVGKGNDAALLVGCGRSGTSWLGDLLCFPRSIRSVFEPLGSHVGGRPMSLVDTYSAPDAEDAEAYRFLSDVFAGNFRHWWTDLDNKSHFCVYRRRVIKEIRLMMGLDWIRQNFPALKIILVLRHPVMVAKSQMRGGWPDLLDSFLSQEILVANYLSDHVSFIEELTDPFSRKVAKVCIEMSCVLSALSPVGGKVVFYEDLIRDPEDCLNSINTFLGWDFDEKVLSIIGRRSSKTNMAVPAEDRLLKNQKERDQVYEIIKRFGLSRVYNKTPFPDEGFDLSNWGD